VSGKGGTGKTTFTASLGVLLENSLLADCDVDASNLYILFPGDPVEEHEYYRGKKAVIDQEKCDRCGICERVCRFDAIIPGEKYGVDQYACEGCNACVVSCPRNAITLVQSLAGRYFFAWSGGKPIVYARLSPGEENSGGLVAEVRKLALEKAKELKRDYVIIDGAPGIGCSATSSIVGVNYVVVVTEPTMSGLHDLKRIVETLKCLKREFGIVINKYDINSVVSREIEDYCLSEGLDLLGKIPFDETVVRASVECKPVVTYENSPAAESIKKIVEKIIEKIS
jgi:MinD superfamily P-loop ATPase